MSCNGDSSCSCCDCCEGLEVRTPRPVHNRPGQEALAYRVGTHGDFLASQLARLSSQDFPALQKLTTRDPGDPAIALLDGWATVADVLTFYQERLANEGYLRTATERRSVRELGRLVGYTPRPGVAATTHLAFTVEADATTVIPRGTRAQSQPGPGELPQTFETTEEIEARGAWNLLPARTTRPSRLASLSANPTVVYLQGLSTGLTKGDPVLAGEPSAPRPFRVFAVTPEAEQQRTRVQLVPWRSPAPDEPSPATPFPRLTDLLLDLARRPAATPASALDLARDARGLADPATDGPARLLTGLFPQLAGGFYAAWANTPISPAAPLKVWALRARASAFGHNAPRELIRTARGAVTDTREWQALDKTEQEDRLFLDTVYREALPGGWVMIDREDRQPLVTRIGNVAERSRAVYGISGKTTRLTLTDSWLDLGLDVENFGVIRDTAVYLQSEELALAEEPIPEDVCGDRIELAGLYQGLSPGRWVIVAGERTDLTGGVTGVQAAERVMIAAVEQGPAQLPRVAETGQGPPIPWPGDTAHSTLVLAAPLAYCYRRGTVEIWGNVAAASHGETHSEVLGSGAGALAGQQFTLRRVPRTWVSAPTPTGITSTLEVRVNDLLWHEAPSAVRLGPADRTYLTQADDDGVTTVRFGDGLRGARLPSGRENVRASYRVGIGQPGNVAARRIHQLATRPLAVKEVLNPLPATGGADPESRDQARRRVPLAVKALDRLVSLGDYADFARTFAGVGKASAVQLAGPQGAFVHVTIAGEDDVPIAPDSDLFRHLTTALSRYGDRHLPIRLALREARRLVLSVRVRRGADFLWAAVEGRLRAELLAAFAFERRELGEPARLSRVVATCHGVAGVEFVDVEVFAALAATLDPEALAEAQKSLVPGNPPTHLDARLARWDGPVAAPAELLYLSPTLPETLILQEIRP